MGAYLTTISGSVFLTYGFTHNDWAMIASGITILLAVVIQTYIWRNK